MDFFYKVECCTINVFEFVYKNIFDPDCKRLYSAREKVHIKWCTHKQTWRVLIDCNSQIMFEGISNMALIYPKSCVECRVSVFDGQINDVNLKGE